MIVAWQMSNRCFYGDYCSLLSASNIPSIWTFNCPCPLIRTKHHDRRNHVCCFPDQPVFSHQTPHMIDTWHEQYETLRNAFLAYHEPARYLTSTEIDAYYNITPPPSPSTSSASSSSTSSSSSDEQPEEGNMVIKKPCKQPKTVIHLSPREYTRFDDFIYFIESRDLILRTKSCNRLPRCVNERCTYNHTVDDALELFRVPEVIDFYAKQAEIRDRASRPERFVVQHARVFRCSRCRANNCASFMMILLLYTKESRLLLYPGALIDCRICSKKTTIPIYM